MAAALPAANLANLLTLPARDFAVLDVGNQRARLLVAAVSRGRPSILRTEIVDAHDDGFTTAEELREEVRRRLRDAHPEAVVLILAQSQVLLHVLDVPPGDSAETRARVEREAASIGGLSERPWVFDAVRLRPFGGPPHPLAVALCQQDNLDQLLDGYVDQPRTIFDIRCASDALVAAFVTSRQAAKNAVLVELGARHTALTILVAGQAVSAVAFPSGSASFTEALAADLEVSLESAEVIKRSEPPAIDPTARPRFHAAITAWLAELERTVQEWQTDHPALAGVALSEAFLAGGGALQAGLNEALSALGPRRFVPWTVEADPAPLTPDFAVAWGALLLALGLAGPAPCLLPPVRAAAWKRQRLWRALVSANLALAAMLAMAIAAATAYQTRRLSERSAWKQLASDALQQARDIRVLSEGLNVRMDAFRPVLEHQRQTVETLQLLEVLQRQRTNANHWYVLLADAESYSHGSNSFPMAAPPRSTEMRHGSPASSPATNSVFSPRAFVAEICLVPQGEEMRQALSVIVGELKRSPLFRNVDVLPAEQRRSLVATNLIFPDRHFALELNLSEAELLPSLALPKIASGDREARGSFRSAVRAEPTSLTTSNRTGRLR